MISPLVTKEVDYRTTQADVFSELLSKRIIYFSGEVTQETCDVVIAELLYLQSADSQAPISMYIDSPGGEVYSGLALYDTMLLVGKTCKLTTVCTGMAASMGSILMCAGSERLALPHSRIMIHQPLSGTGMAQASDIEIIAKETNNLKTELLQILSDRSGKKFDEVLKDCDRDHWLRADECLPGKYGKKGLIDKIIKEL